MLNTSPNASNAGASKLVDKVASLKNIFQKKNRFFQDADGFYLGQLSNGNPYYLKERQLVNHVEVMAHPKFASDFLRNLISDRIHHGHGLIVLNLKSEPSEREWFLSTVRAAGRESELRQVSLGHPENSVPYNPIQQGTATEIHKLLMNALNNANTWTGELSKDISSTVLLTLLRSLCDYRDRTGENFYLGRLCDLLSVPEALHDFYEKLTAAHCQVTPAMQFLVGKLDQPREQEKLKGLITKLRLLAPWVEGKESTFDFNEALDENRILFFQLNEKELQETSLIYGKMVLQDLMRLVHERYMEMHEGRASVKPSTLVIDDFAGLAVPEFSDFMNWAKNANLGIVFANATRVEMNVESHAGTVMAIGPQTPEDAEYLSYLMGTADESIVSSKKLTTLRSEEAFLATREMETKISADWIKLNASDRYGYRH